MNERPLTETQNKVLGLISSKDKEHPITSYQLSRQAAIEDKDHKIGANLRSVVNALRDKGYPICASNEGYYYPQRPEELADYIQSFNKRIEQQQNARDALANRLMGWIASIKNNAEANPIKPVQEPLFPGTGRID
jgi:hypothetical protein